MLAQAIEQEVADYIARHERQVDQKGRRLVVRNGYMPEREILTGTIVRSGGTAGIGLPIGSLTSQWLANLVLDRTDHHVTESMRIPGYVRYMDDFLLFADQKCRLVVALD